MSGDGAYFSVELDQVAQVAGRLTEITDALDAAVKAATDLQAVAGTNPGFASVDAALACATAWLDEVGRLTGRVATAQGNVTDSLTAYQDSDQAAHDWFRTLDTAIGG
jgi:hypothetical protein